MSLIVTAVITTLAMLTSMSMPPDGNLPEPELNFTATITDSQSVSTKCTKISYGGKTYLTGTRGNASIAVPFEKIRNIKAMGMGKDDELFHFQITLKNGSVVGVAFKGETRVYGQATFGNYSLEMKYLKEVTFSTE